MSRRATYGYIIRSSEQMKWLKIIFEIIRTAFSVWAGRLVGKVEDSTKATAESKQRSQESERRVDQLNKKKDDLLDQLELKK